MCPALQPYVPGAATLWTERAWPSASCPWERRTNPDLNPNPNPNPDPNPNPNPTPDPNPNPDPNLAERFFSLGEVEEEAEEAASLVAPPRSGCLPLLGVALGVE